MLFTNTNATYLIFLAYLITTEFEHTSIIIFAKWTSKETHRASLFVLINGLLFCEPVNY